MRKNPPLLTIVYGLVVFALGFMGYYHAGSLISFVVGGSLGALVMLFGILMLMQKKKAYYAALVLSLFLGIFFGFRFSTKLDFSNISMTFFSAVVVAILAIEIYRIENRSL